MSDPYIGEIRAFGFHFAPRDWAFCNGQLINISQNSALFSILGTTYGGNGTTNFGLPNFQGLAPMHWGNGAGLTPRTLGETLGTSTVTVTPTEMPGHTHLIQSAAAGAAAQSVGTPDSTTWMGNSNPGGAYSDTTNPLTAQFSPKAISPNGGNQAHENMQPVLAVNFCIALYGVFPVRN